ncbi:hypothetical protein [Corynebacterium cystitidis]|uniref:hypothetical protein n=1 Tax=Corynebacterium cystitidis TaxID=35757 RepID=UPI00211ED854|nr:hypothetical protein [Corynebacterium cystitidis]
MPRGSEDAARTRARAFLAGPRNKQQQRADHMAALVAHADAIQVLETTLGQTVADLIELGLAPEDIADLTGMPLDQVHHWDHVATPSQNAPEEA